MIGHCQDEAKSAILRSSMRNPIVIREVRPDDLPEILRINVESSPGVTRLTVRGIAGLVTEATLAWVAVTDRDIAGYLIAFLGSASYGGEEFAWFKQRTQNFVYVDQVALARSYRGRGIGSVLYSELERWGSRQQCESLSCEVNLSTEPCVNGLPIELRVHPNRSDAHFRRTPRCTPAKSSEVVTSDSARLSYTRRTIA